ncbi:response regulator [Ancylobacter sp. A5.8]|nr:response regulator [Ancylobacter gelatini]MCJ8143907.1 response regulator [Ancylobacter gelatini]
MPDCRDPEKSTVLVVEDEIFLRIDTVLMVEDAGFDAIEAANADHALTLLASRPDIRVVITDIEMPGSMDGLQLARHVRERWPSLHIIIVSGRQTAGGDDVPENGIFFNKPLSGALLSQALRQFIG